MRDHHGRVVIACACLLHDSGMSIHRTDRVQRVLRDDRLPPPATMRYRTESTKQVRIPRGVWLGAPDRDHQRTAVYP